MTEEKEKKTCFVIMPISDQEGYEKGHFKRVYDYIIEPACKEAGVSPIRADQVNTANYIIIDILKKILDSDIVVCDLSAKNPNVMFELGIRQAFNKPVVLIKDDKTDRVFDIQGLRTVSYDEKLRIDNALSLDRVNITKAIEETLNSKGDDVNSLVQLLSVNPAKINTTTDLSQDTSIVLNSINAMSMKLTEIVDRFDKVSNYRRNQQKSLGQMAADSFIEDTPPELLNTLSKGDALYKCDANQGNAVQQLGEFRGVDRNGAIIIINPATGKTIKIRPEQELYLQITNNPLYCGS